MGRLCKNYVFWGSKCTRVSVFLCKFRVKHHKTIKGLKMSKNLSKIMSVFLAMVMLSTPLLGYDIEAKLKELKIPFEKSEKDSIFTIVTMGGTKVAVMKEGVRNQDNIVVRAIMAIFEPIILTEAQIDNLIKANNGKTAAMGIWGAEDAELGKDSVLLYYEIDIPEDAADKQLTEAIIKCSKVVLPFHFSYEVQYKAAITKVLEIDHDAGRAGSRKETVRRMKEIDLSMCPSDFADAYRRHLWAWENSLDNTGGELGMALGVAAGAGENQDNVAGALLLGIIGGVVGTGIQSASQQDAISSTWDEVKRVARKYGVSTQNW